MLGKVWKKVLLVVLIVACLFDITLKIVKRNSFKNEVQSTVEYFNDEKNDIINKVQDFTNQKK